MVGIIHLSQAHNEIRLTLTILIAIILSKNFKSQVLATNQNLSLLLERDIRSRIIPNENVRSSRITRECVEKSLDTSEKEESRG